MVSVSPVYFLVFCSVVCSFRYKLSTPYVGFYHFWARKLYFNVVLFSFWFCLCLLYYHLDHLLLICLLWLSLLIALLYPTITVLFGLYIRLLGLTTLPWHCIILSPLTRLIPLDTLNHIWMLFLYSFNIHLGH